MFITRSSSRYFSRRSSQNWKKLGSGTQSSSRIMASSTCSNTQLMPLAGRRPHPRLRSAKWRSTWQGQSTCATMSRTAAHRWTSSGRSGRGPSAMRNRRSGRALAISAKTRAVCWGRLKMIKATGVRMLPSPRTIITYKVHNPSEPLVIGFARGRMDHLQDTLLQASLQHIQRPNNIGINEVARCLIGVWNGNERPQVKDDLTIGNGAPHRGGIGQVPEHDFQGGLHVIAHVFQQSPIIARVIVHKRAYAGASAHQSFCKMAPDESPCP